MAKQIPQSSKASPESGISHESIARRAYEIWQSEGCPDGRAMEHWLRAVSELKKQSNRVESTVAEREEQREPEESKPRLLRRAVPRVAEKRFQTAGR